MAYGNNLVSSTSLAGLEAFFLTKYPANLVTMTRDMKENKAAGILRRRRV